MGIITKLECTKRKNGRKNIYLDDEYVCTLDDFSIFKNKIVVGREIAINELQAIQIQSDADYYFQKMVQILSKTAKTTKQVREYLAGLGLMKETIQIVLDKLNEYKLVNDEIYAKRYWDNHKTTRGVMRIRFELRQKGIAESVIDEVLQDVDNQNEEVWILSLKYMKGKELNYTNYNKLMRYLAGKGFCMDDINVAIQRLKAGEDNENWE